MSSVDRRAELEQLLSERILILDGAMGTMIQNCSPTEADFRGERFADHPSELKGNNAALVLSQPALVAEIHDAFFAAGADIIETNTFGANAIAQADYGMEAFVFAMNLRAAEIAAAGAAHWTQRTPERPRFVAGALGPTPKTLSISPDVDDAAARNLSFDELRAAYREQTGGAMYTVEITLKFLHEVNAADTITAESQVASHDAKRLRVHSTLLVGQTPVASGESLYLHVDTTTGKVSPFPDDRVEVLARALVDADDHDEAPASS